ncbi:3-oxoacyl-ACP reductase [Lysinibacillus sp. LZ02]|uniref:3-oxoacyl-ACP reductase n=1 Tax=Lysinibacillus sp. LZ02 TaxID=3420668 RepID=UPI003D36C3E7
MMAKLKGKGVVLAGLVAGVVSYLSKKENRNKTVGYLSQLKKEMDNFQKGTSGMQGAMNATKESAEKKDIGKNKAATFMAMTENSEKHPEKETLEDIASTAAQAANTVLEGNHMIDEGAQTTVLHYNEEQHQQNEYR